MKPFIVLLALFILCSCTRYHYTSAGGARVAHPESFMYRDPVFRSGGLGLIDTNAIYIGFSHTLSRQFIRFFSTGQIIYYYADTRPTAEQLNNKDFGFQGYFYVEKNHIRISRYEEENGGEISLWYGKILEDGNLRFYDDRPTTTTSFEKLEKNSRSNAWMKTLIPGMLSYRPDW